MKFIPNQGFTVYAITTASVATLNTKTCDLYSAEKIKQFIREHQNNWAGYLHNLSLEERADYYARGCNRAAEKGVVWAPRIIQEDF